MLKEQANGIGRRQQWHFVSCHMSHDVKHVHKPQTVRPQVAGPPSQVVCVEIPASSSVARHPLRAAPSVEAAMVCCAPRDPERLGGTYRQRLLFAL